LKFRLEYAYARQRPIAFREIESIADDKGIWDSEPNMIRLYFQLASLLFVEKYAGPEGGGLRLGQVFHKLRKRVPCIQDIIDQEHVLIFNASF
jgi:hypothetical protein